MAGNYTVLGSNTTTELVGTDQTQDVQQITCQAQPSGIVFPVRVPLANFTPQAVDAAASPLADRLNALAQDPGVGAVTITQDITAAGQLQDVATVTVVSTSSNSSQNVEGTLADVLAGTLDAAIAAARSNLDAIEAL